MKYRTLGRTGLRVSEIGFGCWGIGGEWGSRDDDEAVRALRLAFDHGVTFYDTALGYGMGHSERLIRRALGDHLNEIVIATKVPPKTWRWPATADDPPETVFPADWIVECTEKSLVNLGRDFIDVQQLHTWVDAYTNCDFIFEAVERLKEQGKIRHFGISANDWDPYGTVGVVNADKVASIQVIYNIFEQRPEERLFPAAMAHNVGIIVRVPFEEGLLTGTIPNDHVWPDGDWRREWLTPERLREGNRRVEELRAFLSDEVPSLAYLALRFTLSHPAVSTVIPGMRRASRIAENCSASDGKPLTQEILDALKAHAFVHGWKYPWS